MIVLKSRNGITLTTLIITIVVLIIIAGTATYTGMNVYQDAKEEAFIQELQIIQNAVNNEYAKIESGDISWVKYGIDPDAGESLPDIGYKKLTPERLEMNLNLKNIKQTVYINFLTKDVISKDGIIIDNNTIKSLKELEEYNIISPDTNTIRNLYINTTNTTNNINTHNNYINEVVNNITNNNNV